MQLLGRWVAAISYFRGQTDCQKKLDCGLRFSLPATVALVCAKELPKKKSKYIQVVHVPFFGGTNFQVR